MSTKQMVITNEDQIKHNIKSIVHTKFILEDIKNALKNE